MSKQAGLKSITLWLMAVATGLSVANLYYNQPLLEEMRQAFGVSVKDIGFIPTLTQIGYALGMLFLVPLGDKLEKRSLASRFLYRRRFYDFDRGGRADRVAEKSCALQGKLRRTDEVDMATRPGGADPS